MGTNSRRCLFWGSILALFLKVTYCTSDAPEWSGGEVTIVEGPDAYFEIGSPITLTCIIKSLAPPAYIFWYHNQQHISYGSRKDIFFLTERRGWGDTTTSALNILRADLDDQGKYTCSPSNGGAAIAMVYIVDGSCWKDIYADNGTVQSPNYPEAYRESENCLWKIIVPEGHLILLEFDFMDVPSDSRCTRDGVTILDGYGEDNPVLKKLCNINKYNLDTMNIWSSDNKMTVKFVSDDSIQGIGFSATFKKVTLCGDDLFEDHGVLQSPEDNFPYICTWNISVPERNKVVLKIAKDQNENYGMESFYVSIKDSTGSIMKTFFYLDEERTFLSGGNKMTVVVQSDGSEGLPRFYASFEKDSCGTDIITDSGTIASREFPNIYIPFEDCTWKITVPENYSILLKFRSFELEDHDSCGYDFIEVRDGDSPDSILLGKFCGSNVPENLRSTSNKMYIRFVTDASSQYRGFSAEFTKVAA